MVDVVGPAPDFIVLGGDVVCTFVFDSSTGPTEATATSATYAGLYGWVEFSATEVRLLYDVTLIITNDATGPFERYDYIFRGVTDAGWEVVHSAYGTHPSFVPSLALPTVSPPWPPEPDGFAAGYIDVRGPATEWYAYSDAWEWFNVLATPPDAGRPSIIKQPASEIVTPGKTAKFDVKVSSSTPVIFQWLKNNLPVTGATSNKLKIKKATSDDTGTYRVLIGNDSGVVVSEPALLTLN